MYQTYLKKILLVPIQCVQWNRSTGACLKVSGINDANADPIAATGLILDDNLSPEEVLTSSGECLEFLQLSVVLLFRMLNNYTSMSYAEDGTYNRFLSNIVADHVI